MSQRHNFIKKVIYWNTTHITKLHGAIEDQSGGPLQKSPSSAAYVQVMLSPHCCSEWIWTPLSQVININSQHGTHKASYSKETLAISY